MQVDAGNAQLLEQHVCCAAVESPVMYEKDEPYFGPGLADAMQALYMQGQSALLLHVLPSCFGTHHQCAGQRQLIVLCLQ